jgi:hypothetical protein
MRRCGLEGQPVPHANRWSRGAVSLRTAKNSTDAGARTTTTQTEIDDLIAQVTLT